MDAIAAARRHHRNSLLVLQAAVAGWTPDMKLRIAL